MPPALRAVVWALQAGLFRPIRSDPIEAYQAGHDGRMCVVTAGVGCLCLCNESGRGGSRTPEGERRASKALEPSLATELPTEGYRGWRRLHRPPSKDIPAVCGGPDSAAGVAGRGVGGWFWRRLEHVLHESRYGPAKGF